MRAAGLLVLVAACWTSSPAVYTSPVLHVHAPRPPKPELDDCQERLTELWHLIDTPAVEAACDDDDDYWWCVYNAAATDYATLNAAAYWAVLYCEREPRPVQP